MISLKIQRALMIRSSQGSRTALRVEPGNFIAGVWQQRPFCSFPLPVNCAAEIEYPKHIDIKKPSPESEAAKNRKRTIINNLGLYKSDSEMLEMLPSEAT